MVQLVGITGSAKWYFNINNVDNQIFQYTDIHQFAVNAGMTYELDERAGNGLPSSRQMNEWLFYHLVSSYGRGAIPQTLLKVF